MMPMAHRGFTLIELMIALTIAGLVFFVALPGYQSVLMKSYRAAGRGVLLDTLSRQEQYFINNKRYAPDLASLGLPQTYYIDSQAQESAASRAVYGIELAFDVDGYSGVRAIPQNRQRNDRRCMTFFLSREGVRAVSGSFSPTPHRCWK